MKLAILGGSFNPIHQGHLYLADTVLSELGYERVLLIPAFISPFKRDAEAAPAEDRLDMILASIPADPRLGADDAELLRGGVSFTIDTVSDIIERYRPEGKPGLIIGDDLVQGFSGWKSAGELAASVDIIIAQRTGGNEALAFFPYPARILTNSVFPVSSAEIRRRIASKEAWRSLVPPGVRRIIEKKGLYGYQADFFTGDGRADAPPGEEDPPDWALIAAVEDAARAELETSRFLHSRNTALMAGDLARRYGLDPKAAYLAGISHDLGKALDGKTVRALAEKRGPIPPYGLEKPGLLHGRAAAVLLRERFGVHNEDVIEAVDLHTTGTADGTCPGKLAMVLFVADKLEFSRRGIRRREPAAGAFAEGPEDSGLERLFWTVLEDNVRYLGEKKLKIAEETLKLYETFKRKRQ